MSPVIPLPTPVHAPPADEVQRTNLRWLLSLRTVALVGQALLAVGTERLLGVPLPLAPMLALLGFGLLLNLVARSWLQGAPLVTQAPVLALMVIDAAVLTVELALAGGPRNPFSVLYLVNVALGAVVLERRAAWLVALLNVAGFGLLWLIPLLPLEGWLRPPSNPELQRMHLAGVWIATALSAGFIVHFVLRVRSALAAGEAELARSRELAGRQARLASLSTLAAGAAHELSTPLSTIAVVSTELGRAMQTLEVPGAVREDVALIRGEVERCRKLLAELAAATGSPLGEAPARIEVETLVEEAVNRAAGWKVELSGAPGLFVRGPRAALIRAVRSLIKNGVQASPSGGAVAVSWESELPFVLIDVVDAGSGLAAEVRERAGEPFFTTKAPGEGMGLGLFLVRSLAEQLGGSFSLLPGPHGAGTRARLMLPLALETESPT